MRVEGLVVVLLRVPRTLHLLLLTPWTAVVAGAVVPAAQPPGVPSQQGHGRARTQVEEQQRDVEAMPSLERERGCCCWRPVPQPATSP